MSAVDTREVVDLGAEWEQEKACEWDDPCSSPMTHVSVWAVNCECAEPLTALCTDHALLVIAADATPFQEWVCRICDTECDLVRIVPV